MNLSQFKKSSLSSSPHLMLVGNQVAHSLSPLMHNTAAEYYQFPLRYHAVQVQDNELPSLASYLNNEYLRGVNVTIPYKQLLLNYMDQLDPRCQKIGALNTIVKDENKLIGFNTDVIGFCAALTSYATEITGARSIVFGTGGAARAIVFGLKALGLGEIILVSRRPEKAADKNWPEHVQLVSYDAWPALASDATLFVNATPLGMAPNTEKSPVKRTEVALLAHKICYDIVYQPEQTLFLNQAQSVDARTIGGLEMLIQQGSHSFELWTGRPFPMDIVRDKLRKHLNHAH